MEQKHRDNLLTLAQFLENNRVICQNFDMSNFVEPCGSAACAMGWAPVALGHYSRPPGLPPTEFCLLSTDYFDLDDSSPEWDWLFSGEWAAVDNTPEGAAWRIRYLLTHGVTHDLEDCVDYLTHADPEETVKHYNAMRETVL